MNILEAYILQKKFLTIVISCLDINLLKDIGKNIANDLHANIIDLTSKINNITSLDELDLDNIHLLDSNSAIKIILSPFYPDNFFKFRINFHINISLNKKILEEKKIDKNLIALSEEVTSKTRINKFLNLSKFDNNHNLENEIFSIVMEYIKKKLDNGNYLTRIENSSNQNNDTIEDKNNEVDNQIMEQIELDSDEPLIDVANEIKAVDVNMDDELIPTKDFSDTDGFHDLHEVKQYGGIDKEKMIEDLTESISEYLYSKIINNKEVMGRRMLKKKIILKKNEI